MKCHRCGLDPNKSTGGTCACLILWVLCTCGKYVKEGEIHYHINEET